MGEVVGLAEAQRRRAEVRRARAEQAVMHPALRWYAGDDISRAHRRRHDGGTACGAEGPLVLADRNTAFCPLCYPYWASARV